MKIFKNRNRRLLSTVTVAVTSLLGAHAFAQDENEEFSGFEFSNDGLRIEGENVSVSLGGRIHYDIVSLQEDTTPLVYDSSALRRLRVDATFEFGDDWALKLDHDIGGVSTGWKNAWLSYRGIDRVTLRAGQFIAPLTGDNMMNSSNLKLPERAAPNVLAPNFLTGLAANYRTQHVSITAGVFGNAIDTDPLRTPDEGTSVIGRVVFAPIRTRNHVAQVAVAAERRELNTGEPTRVRSRHEFSLFSSPLLDTSALNGVSGYTTLNAEAMVINGPLLVRAQVTSRQNDAPTLGDPTFTGQAIEGAWVLTGERQRYGRTNGNYGYIRPEHSWGAIEVAARLSELDLNDGTVSGGSDRSASIGINWYVNDNVRVMTSYIRSEIDPAGGLPTETVRGILTRFQVAY